jgi:hypothetical protein
MKKIAFILFTSLLFWVQNGFAQIKPGTYYTVYGLVGRIVKIDIEETADKGLKFRLDGTDYEASPVSPTRYQGKENRCQLKLRDDKDIELYTMYVQFGTNPTDLVNGVYLLTSNKEEAKERWKKVKDELRQFSGKDMAPQEDIRFAYFYTWKNDTEYIKLKGDTYTGADEVEIYFSQYTNRTYEKLAENTYIYASQYSGSVELSFARFFPAENKIIIIRQPLSDEPDVFVAQKSSAPTKNEADDKKVKDFQDYIQNYLVKYRIAYFNNFKSNTSADLPQTKILAATKTYFEEEYNVTKVKLITSAWTLERNEFGRTMRRLHTILAYLKDKKTGKCYVAFRHIGQEFDGSSYGEVLFYARDATYYDLVDDKKNTLQVYLLSSTYELSCAETSK